MNHQKVSLWVIIMLAHYGMIMNNQITFGKEHIKLLNSHICFWDNNEHWSSFELKCLLPIKQSIQETKPTKTRQNKTFKFNWVHSIIIKQIITDSFKDWMAKILRHWKAFVEEHEVSTTLAVLKCQKTKVRAY